MKSYKKELHFNLPTRRGLVNITRDVQQAIDESGVKEGLCLINPMHITASVIINDDEPAVCMPVKVAQLMPRGPGVISAMATRLARSSAVIQPWEDISSRIRGTMDMPPKLVNPIFMKETKSCR